MKSLQVLQGPQPGKRFPLVGDCTVIGRQPDAHIYLDSLAVSRLHAQILCQNGAFFVEDIGSSNGTWLNGTRITNRMPLTKQDELQIGPYMLTLHTDGPDSEVTPNSCLPEEGLAIRKRLWQTELLIREPPSKSSELPRQGPGTVCGVRRQVDPTTPQPQKQEADSSPTVHVEPRHSQRRDLARLYRLALDMGAATNLDELCRTVLDSLLAAIPAEIGAILFVRRGDVKAPPAIDGGKSFRAVDMEVAAHQRRNTCPNAYMGVSEYVSNEVLASREALLVENVKNESKNHWLRHSKSFPLLGATSAICAPIIFDQGILGLIHLYCTDSHKALDPQDLEFTLAVAQQLGSVIYQLQRTLALTDENRELRDQLGLQSELVGESPTIKNLEIQITRVAGTNATCLIRGESGSGKELVARAIHFSSPRKDGPFVCLNCAAIMETLLESELFGHEKGSFTGATEKKIGKFEAANHGTIFLDEIGEMNFGTQAKLLRILEGQPFERVGGNVAISTDVRVVAATNQPLERAVEEGRFRSDLFFRLQVVELQVAPLRERKSDVLLLADHFLKRFVRETGRRIRGFTPTALKRMEEYHWPGNVRELRNSVERAVALGTGPFLDANDFNLPTPSIAATQAPCSHPTHQHTSPDNSASALLHGNQLLETPTAVANWTEELLLSLARHELQWIDLVMKLHRDKGEASTALYGNRFKLTKTVRDYFRKYPALRENRMLKNLVERFPLIEDKGAAKGRKKDR